MAPDRVQKDQNLFLTPFQNAPNLRQQLHVRRSGVGATPCHIEFAPEEHGLVSVLGKGRCQRVIRPVLSLGRQPIHSEARRPVRRQHTRKRRRLADFPGPSRCQHLRHRRKRDRRGGGHILKNQKTRSPIQHRGGLASIAVEAKATTPGAFPDHEQMHLPLQFCSLWRKVHLQPLCHFRPPRHLLPKLPRLNSSEDRSSRKGRHQPLFNSGNGGDTPMKTQVHKHRQQQQRSQSQPNRDAQTKSLRNSPMNDPAVEGTQGQRCDARNPSMALVNRQLTHVCLQKSQEQKGARERVRAEQHSAGGGHEGDSHQPRPQNRSSGQTDHHQCQWKTQPKQKQIESQPSRLRERDRQEVWKRAEDQSQKNGAQATSMSSAIIQQPLHALVYISIHFIFIILMMAFASQLLQSPCRISCPAPEAPRVHSATLGQMTVTA